MQTLLLSLPTWLLGIIVIGGSTALSVAGMLLLRPLVARSMSEGHNDIVAVTFGVIGAVYSVFLAFIIVVDWNQFTAADDAVTHEAAVLTSLYRGSDVLPQPVRGQAQHELENYTRLVMTKEWQTMAHGADSKDVDGSLDHLYHIYGRLNSLPREAAMDSESLRQLDQLTEQRSIRVNASDGSLNQIFWVILFFGAIVTVGIGFLFYLKNVWIQAILQASATAVLASLLFLLMVIDHPFSGDVHVSFGALQTVLEHMQGFHHLGR